MLAEDATGGMSLFQLTEELCELEGITLESLKLRSGKRLKLQSLRQNRPAIEAAYISALNKRRIFVVLPGFALHGTWLEIGEKCLVSGVSGAHDFLFEANVLDLQEWPFVHAHLGYPALIEYPGR